MDGLTDQHRLALEWKYVDGLSVRDMAHRWSTTEKAVESILFRARNEFRSAYDRGSVGAAATPVEAPSKEATAANPIKAS